MTADPARLKRRKFAHRQKLIYPAQPATPPAEPVRPPAPAGALRQWARRARPLLAAGLLALLGAVIYRALYPPQAPLTPRQVEQIAAERLAAATPAAAYSAQVYQVILPSLVLIETHGGSAEARQQGHGIGTGVVINTRGDILTAYHVVAGDTEIDVLFADGSRAMAEVFTAQPQNDIAVLHPLTPPDLIVPAVLGSSSGTRVGDEAFAVGNPLGLVASISSGVISGLNRSYELDGGGRIEGLIQFDAAVNPGNSGGPLLNRSGQVIGIVTSLANPTEGGDFFIGIGFAVPIGEAVGAAGAPEY
jgi:S1-C subfamily serine protease